MEGGIGPALSADEWSAIKALPDQLNALRERLLDTPFSAHAIAALLLFGEPFGFTQQDVDDENQVAAYCEAMVAERLAGGDGATAETFRSLGARHLERAKKIAALIPPPGGASPA